MKSSLQVGEYFRFKYRCEFDYGRVVIDNGVKCYQVVSCRSITLGTVVHNAVWVDHDTLQSRGTFKFKGPRKGDRGQEV